VQSKLASLVALVAMLAVATLPAIAQNVAPVGQLPEEANAPVEALEMPPAPSCDAGAATNEDAAVQYVAEVCVVEVPPGTEVGTELSTQLGTETL
jgi:hypothetical protein